MKSGSYRIFHGQNQIESIVRRLVDASIYFAVTPLPDDQWQVMVKLDDGHVLDRIVDAVQNRFGF